MPWETKRNHEYLDNNITKKSIIRINNGNENTFLVDDKGNVSMTGHVVATSGEIGGVAIESLEDSINQTHSNLFIPELLQVFQINEYTPLSDKNGWRMRSDDGKGNGGIKIAGNTFVNEQDYVISFKFKKIDGTLASIGGHS